MPPRFDRQWFRLLAFGAPFVTILCFFAVSAPCLLAQDCDRNGVADADDIAAGQPDCNDNGVLDACEFLPLVFGRRGESLMVSSEPRLAVHGDFNDDGLVDLVVGKNRRDVSSLSLFLSDGERQFQAEVVYDTARRLTDLVAVDLDMDGDLDLASVNSSVVQVFENAGDGTLGEPVDFTVPGSTRFMAAADVTGDGAPDIITVNPGDDAVNWLANQGDGTFGAARGFFVGDRPEKVVTGDFDEDGDVDVAVANRDAEAVAVFSNSGTGVFSPAGQIAVPGRMTDLLAGDVDLDGHVDFVTALQDRVQLWRGLGDGTFMAEAQELLIPAEDLVLADFNDDGADDLAIGSFDRTEISLLINQGAGTFRAPQRFSGDFVSFTVADFEGDGDLDFALAARGPDRVTFSWGGERAALAFERETFDNAVGQPHGVTTADFDADGWLDVVTTTGDGGTRILLFNEGDGRLRTPIVRTIEDTHANSVVAGDFDSDGDSDIVIYGPRGEVVVELNMGAGEFAEPVFYPSSGGGRFLLKVDVDSDGHLDVVASDFSGSLLAVHFNDGAAGFAERLDLPTGNLPWENDAGDLDGDGDIDLVSANPNSSDITLFFNEGERSFAPGVFVPIPGRPQGIKIVDLNDDGNLDIVTANAGDNDVAVLLNPGDATFDGAPMRFSIDRSPIAILAVELDGDGFLDLVTTNEGSDSISILRGRGDGTFAELQQFSSGIGPRISTHADIDNDGDQDIIVANRLGRTVDVLYNQQGTLIDSDLDFLETVCTELDLEKISVASSGAVERVTKYLIPAREEDTLLPPVFQNVRRFALHQEFLVSVFPERFAGLTTPQYIALVEKRATRDYFAGVLRRLRDDAGNVAYGFSVIVDESSPGELLSLEETRGIFESLRQAFQLEPLGYFPDTRQAREVAAAWPDPGFPILTDDGPEIEFEAYTRAVGFGRVQLLDQEGFDEANENGRLSFQNILVLDRAPRDIEGVVGGVITGEPQGELSHLAIRTARRGTPNAFVQDASEIFGPFDGLLVRLEVTDTQALVREATLEEAEAFWEANRPQLSVLPMVDPDWSELSSLEEIASMEAMGAELVPRFGGKASNLARLQTILDGGFSEYRELGFAIPVRYYLEFLRMNRMPSALDPAREVTYEEYLLELFEDEQFRTSSEFRFGALDDLRDHMRDEGVVDSDLVARIAARIPEVLGSPSEVRVRFRSSSNTEDALEFNGAGLYDSTSGCAQDDLDEDDVGPSHCDPTRDNERGITRALKRVWRSLWNFRAYEEREFFGLPQDLSAMAILVNRSFIDEAAQGVAFTGDPSNPDDRRYVITVQAGEESVVSPEPGIRAEKNVLEIVDGQVTHIDRAVSSSLVPPGEFVLSSVQLEELGGLMAHIDANFPLELGEYSRDQVLLDLEFKFMPDGELAVKQVRPFLLSAPPLPSPTFELAVPENLEICGVFADGSDGRGPLQEYELKSTLRLIGGTVLLPTSQDRFEADLFDEVRFGPGRQLAQAMEPGAFRLQRLPAGGDLTVYRFTYAQEFLLADGRTLLLRWLSPIEFRARGEEVLRGPDAIDEAFFTVRPGQETIQAEIDGVPSVRYGSCTNSTLPLLAVDAVLEDGTALQLQERWREEDSILDTAPASLVRAQIDFGGRRRVVSEYWDLIYSAFRHNRSVTYWVILDPPIVVEGVAVPIHAIELQAPEPIFDRVVSASYLDENFGRIRTLAVSSFEKGPAVVEPFADFRRGDFSGDGSINLIDQISCLEYLFRGGAPPVCEKAADANDDGRLNILDAVAGVAQIFLRLEIPAPSPDCGQDPTADSLTCDEAVSCP